MEALLTAHLLATAGVTALVGGIRDGELTGEGRVVWDELPRAESLPAVILHKDFTERLSTFRGRISATMNGVQVDCWAATKVEAIALRDQVLLALSALTERPLQVKDFGDDPPDRSDTISGPDADRATAMHASSVIVHLWHDPTA